MTNVSANIKPLIPTDYHTKLSYLEFGSASSFISSRNWEGVSIYYGDLIGFTIDYGIFGVEGAVGTENTERLNESYKANLGSRFGEVYQDLGEFIISGVTVRALISRKGDKYKPDVFFKPSGSTFAVMTTLYSTEVPSRSSIQAFWAQYLASLPK